MNIAQLRSTIQPLRQTLLNHPIYKDLRTATALRTFMEYHVFAVWDFMSLLKTLQRRLSCVSVPWLPNSSLSGCRLVNEIVLAEESDADGQGGFASHFGLYHGAMVAFGARTDGIDQFVNLLRDGHSIDGALQASNAHEPIRHFVKHTFDSIASEDLCGIASTFTFGREDLLPDVFQKIVQQLNQDVGGNLNSFEYYLKRHIELDGDEHGPLAARLIVSLCGADEMKWQRAEQAATASLQARILFWNAIHDAIKAQN